LDTLPNSPELPNVKNNKKPSNDKKTHEIACGPEKGEFLATEIS
jgi:hypothetical protein